LARCPVQILNLGENIDASLDPQPIWREHLVPYYRKRVDELHTAGNLVSIHVDGTMRPLLKHLRDCPWDGIEAATPVLQRDVSLEEIKDALGDLILLDGIPALGFPPEQYSVEGLVECVKQVVDLFHPRLILGISDEIPPDGDIERVQLVGDLVQELVWQYPLVMIEKIIRFQPDR
jgi:uroporphyrinogen-III decarboxylase